MTCFTYGTGWSSSSSKISSSSSSSKPQQQFQQLQQQMPLVVLAALVWQQWFVAPWPLLLRWTKGVPAVQS
jgi:hypothetical protein